MSTSTQIDLMPFCDPDSFRFAINKPWTKGGKRYATNGIVAVRLLVPDEPDCLPEGRVPNVDEIIPPVDGQWQEWPVVEPCPTCAGEHIQECDNCRGNGGCDGCRCGSDHECGKCDGTGKTDCKDCRATGSYLILFGKVQLARRWAWIISKLPGVKYLPQDDPGKLLRFAFDGGDGAVMGLSPEKSKR